MITMKRYVFDLDNTLIYTDSLNNDSYNYALELCELAPIKDCKRITRNVIFYRYPNLNNTQKNEIIKLKQEYFVKNLHFTEPNTSLLQVLRTQNADSCMLWTSADEPRVLAILEYYNIGNAFRKILYSNKVEVKKDVPTICELFDCDLEHLIFYEDNLRVIQDLQRLKVSAMHIQ